MVEKRRGDEAWSELPMAADTRERGVAARRLSISTLRPLRGHFYMLFSRDSSSPFRRARECGGHDGQAPQPQGVPAILHVSLHQRVQVQVHVQAHALMQVQVSLPAGEAKAAKRSTSGAPGRAPPHFPDLAVARSGEPRGQGTGPR